MSAGDDSLSASPESHLGALLQLALSRQLHSAPAASAASLVSSTHTPLSTLHSTPSDFPRALEAFRTFFEASGYPLSEEQVLAIITGDAVPDRPIDFIELAGDYFQLSADDRLAVLFQIAYDILRQNLGPEFYDAVFHPAATREDGERTNGARPRACKGDGCWPW